MAGAPWILRVAAVCALALAGVLLSTTRIASDDAPLAPILDEPAAGAIVGNPGNREAKCSPWGPFRWHLPSGSPPADRYRLYIERGDFLEIVIDVTVRDTSYSWCRQELTPDSRQGWLWRVQAFSPSGAASYWSENRVFYKFGDPPRSPQSSPGWIVAAFVAPFALSGGLVVFRRRRGETMPSRLQRLASIDTVGIALAAGFLVALWPVKPATTLVLSGFATGVFLYARVSTLKSDPSPPVASAAPSAQVSIEDKVKGWALSIGILAVFAWLILAAENNAFIALPFFGLIVGVILTWVAMTAASNIRGPGVNDASARRARALGLTYAPTDVSLRAEPFPLFSGDLQSTASDVLRGDWRGMPVTVFTYARAQRFVPGIADMPRSFSCAVTTLSFAAPPLAITRRPTDTSTTTLLPDVSLEGAEFERLFRVQCDDRSFAFGVLDVALMAWLSDHAGDWSVELAGHQLLCYSPLGDTERVEELLGVLRELRGRIPAIAASAVAALPTREAPRLMAVASSAAYRATGAALGVTGAIGLTVLLVALYVFFAIFVSLDNCPSCAL